jgi:hypothetical protein
MFQCIHLINAEHLEILIIFWQYVFSFGYVSPHIALALLPSNGMCLLILSDSQLKLNALLVMVRVSTTKRYADKYLNDRYAVDI